MNNPKIGDQVYYDGVMAGFTCTVYKVEDDRAYFSHHNRKGNVTFSMSCPVALLQVVNSGHCRWAIHFNNCRPEA